MEPTDEQPNVSGAVMKLELLIAMANQIGDFFSPYPPERATEGLRNHLRTYWDPRMRSALLAHIDAGGEGLSELVVEGARLLRDDAAEKDGYYGPPKR
ncbi:MAG: formate dehydrogenase subunit delta [Gammaproteobacteria bacterium]|nr:formate dehydrogenase subunit delta [Gammaproteobacteria bacterium]MDH3507571.1 formate dehydrogenase subunit delta [Gammaproteobacteria bacterium]